MGVILTATAGLCIWIVLWAFGISGFDAFIITATMTLAALALRNVTTGLFGRRE